MRAFSPRRLPPYRSAIATTNSSRTAMLTSLIDITPAAYRRGANQMRQQLRACPEIIESTFDRVQFCFTTAFSYHVVLVIDVEPIRERFSTLAPFLDERGRRLVAAAEAFAAGYGGITAVAMATGMAPSTIGRGLKELAQDEPSGRVRRPGAGRKPAIDKVTSLGCDLQALVEPTTRGDPQ